MPERSRTIVVVEDDAGMRHAIERLLVAKGYQTRMFESAEALLVSGSATDADCLILDIHLPGMSGPELQDELARRGLAAPVVFITADDKPASRARAARSGSAFLAKPFQGRVLLDTVAHALAGSTNER